MRITQRQFEIFAALDDIRTGLHDIETSNGPVVDRVRDLLEEVWLGIEKEIGESVTPAEIRGE